jgi:hypothetical protein
MQELTLTPKAASIELAKSESFSPLAADDLVQRLYEDYLIAADILVQLSARYKSEEPVLEFQRAETGLRWKMYETVRLLTGGKIQQPVRQIRRWNLASF